MSEDFSTYELIDQYLDGKLEEEALLDFQLSLELDANLKEQLEFQKLANEIVKATELNRVKEIIKSEYTDTSIFYLRYSKYILGIALVVASLTSMYVYSFYTKKEEAPNQGKQEVETVVDTNKTAQKPIENQSKIEWKGVEVKEEQTHLNIPKINSIVATTKEVEAPVNQEFIVKETITPVLKEKPILTAKKEDEKSEKGISALVDSCSLYARTFDLNISPSCETKASGGVYAKSLKNSQTSYQYKLNGPNSFKKEQSSLQFDDLSSGNYTLIVTKDKKCEVAKQSFFVPIDLSCLKQKTYSFNPNYGEGFVFTDLKENQAILELYDRAGKLIVKKEVSKQEEFLWDGRGANGEMAPTGSYFFFITYKSEKQDLGEILLY